MRATGQTLTVSAKVRRKGRFVIKPVDTRRYAEDSMADASRSRYAAVRLVEVQFR